jgi:hypothetical protein
MKTKVTLTVDEETKKIMDEFPIVNYSGLFRMCVKKSHEIAKEIEGRLCFNEEKNPD